MLYSFTQEQEALMKQYEITFPKDISALKHPTTGEKFLTIDAFVTKTYQGEKYGMPSRNEIREMVKKTLIKETKSSEGILGFGENLKFTEKQLEDRYKIDGPKIEETYLKIHAKRNTEYGNYANQFFNDWIRDEVQKIETDRAINGREEKFHQRNGWLGKLVSGTVVDWNDAKNQRPKLLSINEFSPTAAPPSRDQLAQQMIQNNLIAGEAAPSPEAIETAYTAQLATHKGNLDSRQKEYDKYVKNFRETEQKLQAAEQNKPMPERAPQAVGAAGLVALTAATTYGLAKGKSSSNAFGSAQRNLTTAIETHAADAAKALPTLITNQPTIAATAATHVSEAPSLLARTAASVASAASDAKTGIQDLWVRMSTRGRGNSTSAANSTPVAPVTPTAAPAAYVPPPSATPIAVMDNPAQFLNAAANVSSNLNALRGLSGSSSAGVMQTLGVPFAGCAVGSLPGLGSFGIDHLAAPPERLKVIGTAHYLGDVALRELSMCVAGASLAKGGYALTTRSINPRALEYNVRGLEGKHGPIMQVADDAAEVASRNGIAPEAALLNRVKSAQQANTDAAQLGQLAPSTGGTRPAIHAVTQTP